MHNSDLTVVHIQHSLTCEVYIANSYPVTRH